MCVEVTLTPIIPKMEEKQSVVIMWPCNKLLLYNSISTNFNISYLEGIIFLAVVVFSLQTVVTVFPLDVVVVLVPVRLRPGGGHHVEVGQGLEALPGVLRSGTLTH